MGPAFGVAANPRRVSRPAVLIAPTRAMHEHTYSNTRRGSEVVAHADARELGFDHACHCVRLEARAATVRTAVVSPTWMRPSRERIGSHQVSIDSTLSTALASARGGGIAHPALSCGTVSSSGCSGLRRASSQERSMTGWRWCIRTIPPRSSVRSSPRSSPSRTYVSITAVSGPMARFIG